MDHGVPEALSRNPVNDPETEDNMHMDFGRIAAIQRATSEIGIQDQNIKWLEQEANKDDRYKVLRDAVMSGFSEFKTKYGPWTKSLRNLYVQEFRPHWDQLSTEGSLVVLKNRIFVPEDCRRHILKELQKGHQGITRTLQNARQSVYWHGITKDVENMCNACGKCQRLRASYQKESLEADELPARPFDVVSSDLFYTGGKVFMIVADRLSGFPLVDTWKNDSTSKQVISKLKQYFSLFGKPLKFKSDGGAQFSSRETQSVWRRTVFNMVNHHLTIHRVMGTRKET